MPIPTPGITHSTLPGACAQLLPLSHIQWTSPFRNTKLFLKSSSCHLYCHSLNLHFPISPLALTAPNVSSCIRSQHGDQQKQVEIFFFTLRTVVCLFLAALGLCCCVRNFSSCSAWASHRGGSKSASFLAEHEL